MRNAYGHEMVRPRDRADSYCCGKSRCNIAAIGK